MQHEHEHQPDSGPTALPVGANRRTIREKPDGRLRKVARLAAFTLCVGALVGAFSLHRVRGQLGESLLQAGPEMMMLADADRQDSPRDIVINGETVRLSSGMASYSPSELLDRFEARCETIDAGLMAQFSEAVERAPATERAQRLAGMSPVLREDVRGHGYVACLDLGRESLTLDRLLARFQRFQESHDLHDLGELRYVYAEPASGGRTHFVALWTEGNLRYDRLFPETGDAPGTDVTSIPRPPASRRVLLAYERGIDDVARIYEGSELDESQIESFYRRELPQNGWTILDATDDPRAHVAQRDVRPALVAQRGDQLAFFGLSTDFDGRGRAAILLTGNEDVGVAPTSER